MNTYPDNSTIMTIGKLPTVIWKPKEDITTYELAEATPFLFSLMLGYQNPYRMEDIPECFRRHFTIE